MNRTRRKRVLLAMIVLLSAVFATACSNDEEVTRLKEEKATLENRVMDLQLRNKDLEVQLQDATARAVNFNFCDTLAQEREMRIAQGAPEGMTVIGGDCYHTSGDYEAWPHWAYPGNPGDEWSFIPPTDVVFDFSGTADLQLRIADVIPDSRHPFYPEALTLDDMIPNTLVCQMVGQDTLKSYVVTGVGVEVYENLAFVEPPLFYWGDGDEWKLSLQGFGVIPDFDGTWSLYWLRAGTCDQTS